MKLKNIKMRHIFASLAFTIVLFFPSIGMDEETKPPEVPKPPMITYDQYVNNLLIGESIEGWGDPSGNLGSWLQKTANKRRVSTRDDKPNLALPLFLLTLAPLVEGKRLRADYMLPAPNSDLENGHASLSIFLDVSEEILTAAIKLSQESRLDLAFRLLQWQNQHYITDVLARTVGTELLETGLFATTLLFVTCFGRQLRASPFTDSFTYVKVMMLANIAAISHKFMGVISQEIYLACLAVSCLWLFRELYYASGAFREGWREFNRIRDERSRAS